ncbi:MAG: hypothetical protein QM726_14815 [Chitinophagaceae bacterium]
MKPTEKQASLEHYKKLTLATLEYLMDHHTGQFVCDGWDPMKHYYEDQQLKTNKYFTQRRLDRLQQQSDRLLKMGMRSNTDITTFIQQKTGIEIDAFEDIEEQIKNISQNGRIENQQAYHALSHNLYLLKQANKPIADEAKVSSMIKDYNNRRSKKEHVEKVITDLPDGRQMVSISFSTGPKPKHLERKESTSPDGKRKVMVTEWSDGKNPNTSVTVFFEKASGCIYGTAGIQPDIKAYWKDNNNIVVETKKAYTSFVKHKEIRSYQDIVNVEYIEHD